MSNAHKRSRRFADESCIAEQHQWRESRKYRQQYLQYLAHQHQQQQGPHRPGDLLQDVRRVVQFHQTVTAALPGACSDVIKQSQQHSQVR